MRNLQTLSKEKLASGFDYDSSSEISFAKLVLKLHKSQFPTTGGRRAKEPLGLSRISGMEWWNGTLEWNTGINNLVPKMALSHCSLNKPSKGWLSNTFRTVDFDMQLQ